MALSLGQPGIIAGDKGKNTYTKKIFSGNSTTRAAVLADVDTAPGAFPCEIGSIYMSSAGKQYVKVAQSSPPANTDWQRVTTTAAD